MSISPRQLVRNVFRFGSGEFIARIFSVAVVILLGHLYGVIIVGVYGLAATVSQYLMPVIDFGLKHVGARLMSAFRVPPPRSSGGSSVAATSWLRPRCRSWRSMLHWHTYLSS